MIEQYFIDNFKNHLRTRLELAPLTILAGRNGVGKSSVFQTLLMLRESVRKNGNSSRLNLRGQNFNVGTSSGQLVNWAYKEKEGRLELRIVDHGTMLPFVYDYPMTAEVTSLPIQKELRPFSLDELQPCSLFNNNFQYLSAFRNGPLESYDWDSHYVDEERQLSSRMGLGDMAVYFLNKFAKEDIPVANLAYPGTETRQLRVQVEAWMSEIAPRTGIIINQKGDKYELLYAYKRPGDSTKYVSALNTGYGISYVLSVIIAVLSSRPGALLLVENPEAHIHPASQAALMRLLGQASHNGIQVILETHSDHILDGALVAVKQGRLLNTELAVKYFDVDEYNTAQCHDIPVMADGRMPEVPEGFFDQFSIDMEILTRPSKR